MTRLTSLPTELLPSNITKTIQKLELTYKKYDNYLTNGKGLPLGLTIELLQSIMLIILAYIEILHQLKLARAVKVEYEIITNYQKLIKSISQLNELLGFTIAKTF